MTERRPIIDLLADTAALTKAMRSAVEAELARHHRLGNPIAVWSNGRVALLSSSTSASAPSESDAAQLFPGSEGEGVRELSP